MNVLIWHVHGSWTTSFVQGDHRYLVPVVEGRGPQGRGRARTWSWPVSVVERTPAQLRDEDIDVVVLQEEAHEQWATAWLGRRPGRDIPAIWLEHNIAPELSAPRHAAADRDDVVIVHVTHTNHLLWDCGTARTTVIEHGIPDPGWHYRGDVERAAVVVNEPVRRGRAVGADLVRSMSHRIPIDLFGMGALDFVARSGAAGVRPYEDLQQQRMHLEIARRRVYLHPVRWTSLGLALIEAMTLGMPVAALAMTEVPSAVPPEAGVVTNDVAALERGLRALLADPDAARHAGAVARAAALERFGLKRFLHDWDLLLEEVVR